MKFTINFVTKFVTHLLQHLHKNSLLKFWFKICHEICYNFWFEACYTFWHWSILMNQDTFLVPKKLNWVKNFIFTNNIFYLSNKAVKVQNVILGNYSTNAFFGIKRKPHSCVIFIKFFILDLFLFLLFSAKIKKTAENLKLNILQKRAFSCAA